MLRNMNNQLTVATVVDMETLQSLAREFKARFELSSGLIHDKLAGKEFLFVCLPLKMRGGTASPVRPVALVM